MKPHRSFASVLFAIVLASAGAAQAQQMDLDEIRIGTEGAYPPWNHLDATGRFEGFEIDYGHALCEKIKRRCRFVAQDWDGMIPGLLAGRYDIVIAGMNATQERAALVDFTAVYSRAPISFIARKAIADENISPVALAGKAVGVQVASVHAKYLQAHYPGSRVELYRTQEQANVALKEGRIDYVLADKLALIDFIAGQGRDCCRFLGDISRDAAIHGPGVAAALRKQDVALRDAVSNAIAESIADGTHRKIMQRYFKLDILGN